MALITLATAKAHLRIAATDARDEDIRRKMAQAEAIILDYLKVAETSPPLWSDETDTPNVVKAAILITLAHLDANRGDDAAGTFRTPAEGLWKELELLLMRQRDPALA